MLASVLTTAAFHTALSRVVAIMSYGKSQEHLGWLESRPRKIPAALRVPMGSCRKTVQVS